MRRMAGILLATVGVVVLLGPAFLVFGWFIDADIAVKGGWARLVFDLVLGIGLIALGRTLAAHPRRHLV